MTRNDLMAALSESLTNAQAQLDDMCDSLDTAIHQKDFEAEGLHDMVYNLEEVNTRLARVRRHIRRLTK